MQLHFIGIFEQISNYSHNSQPKGDFEPGKLFISDGLKKGGKMQDCALLQDHGSGLDSPR
jgi:hypothetical protein